MRKSPSNAPLSAGVIYQTWGFERYPNPNDTDLHATDKQSLLAAEAKREFFKSERTNRECL
jgi:hypothetical protein